MPLSIRSADGAPGLGLQEYFGRLPDSAIRDRDLSDQAKVLLAAVHMLISIERTHPVCLATNAELAQVVGKHERNVRRRLRDLEARGHVECERVRTIAGSPRCIRPLAKLRGVRQLLDRADVPGCNRAAVPAQPDSNARPTGQQCPGDRAAMPALFLEGERKKDPEKRPPDGVEPAGTGTPPPVAKEDEEEDALAALEEMAAKPGPVGAWAKKYLDTQAQGKGPRSSGKIPSGPHARDSAPVEENCTAPIPQPSRPIHDTEHNRH